jgi:DNA-binding Lrp family transcriptional regulator
MPVLGKFRPWKMRISVRIINETNPQVTLAASASCFTLRGSSAPGVLARRPGHAILDATPAASVAMRPIFVMIKTDMGQAYQVAKIAADTIEEMSELYSTSGQYDLLAKFYLQPDQDTGLFVTERVQTIPGVKDTYTLITFNAFMGGS